MSAPKSPAPAKSVGSKGKIPNQYRNLVAQLSVLARDRRPRSGRDQREAPAGNYNDN